ncbi:MAG: hypothetical protein U5L09_09920 [Bacteroidales bacterium]|nr:hypothetical protein [Bacteroidales bacterium]
MPAERSSYRVHIQSDSGTSGQVLLFDFGLLGNSVSAYGIVAGDNVSVPSSGCGRRLVSQRSGLKWWMMKRLSGPIPLMTVQTG